MENMVMKSGPDKRLVLLINKIDLVPREGAERWLNYLREELPTVDFKCSTQEQKLNLGWKSTRKAGKTVKSGKASNIPQTSDCLGVETLIKLLKNYSRRHDMVATIRGKLKKGGIVDVESAAWIVLHDWNVGKIPHYTVPPVRNVEEPSEAKIVSELGKEFNVDEVYGDESSFIGSLKSVDDFNPVEVPSNLRINVNMMILEHDEQPPASTQGNVEAESMESDEKDNIPEKDKYANRKQNKKLYSEEGMLNTKLKKAEKKRLKKDSRPSTMDHDMDGDYDFKVDYVRMETATDVADENGQDGKSSKNRFEVPAGVELDAE